MGIPKILEYNGPKTALMLAMCEALEKHIDVEQNFPDWPNFSTYLARACYDLSQPEAEPADVKCVRFANALLLLRSEYVYLMDMLDKCEIYSKEGIRMNKKIYMDGDLREYLKEG